MKIRLLNVLFLSAILLMSCRPNTQNTVKQDPATQSNPSVGQETLPWAGDQDIVCEMKIDRSVEDTLHYNGTIYGFCGANCKAKFQESPSKYVTK